MIENDIFNLLTPLDKLAARIKERAYYRGWNLKDLQIFQLAKNLETFSHDDDYLVGVDIWIGHDMTYNVFEAIDWLGGFVNDELKLKFKFEYGLINRLTNLVTMENRLRRLDPVRLDFKKFSQPSYALDFSGPKLHCTSIWFLALNPKICLMAKDQPINVVIEDPLEPGKIIASITIRLVDDTVYVNDSPI